MFMKYLDGIVLFAICLTSCMPTATLIKLNSDGSGSLETKINPVELERAISQYDESAKADDKEAFRLAGIYIMMISQMEDGQVRYFKDEIPEDSIAGPFQYMRMMYIVAHKDIINNKMEFSVGIDFTNTKDIDHAADVFREVILQERAIYEHKYFYGIKSFIPPFEFDQEANMIRVEPTPCFQYLKKEEMTRKFTSDKTKMSELKNKLTYQLEIVTSDEIIKAKPRGDFLTKNKIIFEYDVIDLLNGKPKNVILKIAQ